MVVKKSAAPPGLWVRQLNGERSPRESPAIMYQDAATLHPALG